jgi:hypothetical protein
MVPAKADPRSTQLSRLFSSYCASHRARLHPMGLRHTNPFTIMMPTMTPTSATTVQRLQSLILTTQILIQPPRFPRVAYTIRPPLLPMEQVRITHREALVTSPLRRLQGSSLAGISLPAATDRRVFSLIHKPHISKGQYLPQPSMRPLMTR